MSVWTVKLPLAVPTDAALNVTWKLLDWPTGKENGKVSPETENSLLDTVALLMLTETFPIFVTAIVWEIFFPTTVLPKLRLRGAN